jgi:hypothetical protein
MNDVLIDNETMDLHREPPTLKPSEKASDEAVNSSPTHLPIMMGNLDFDSFEHTRSTANEATDEAHHTATFPVVPYQYALQSSRNARRRSHFSMVPMGAHPDSSSKMEACKEKEGEKKKIPSLATPQMKLVLNK